MGFSFINHPASGNISKVKLRAQPDTFPPGCYSWELHQCHPGLTAPGEKGPQNTATSMSRVPVVYKTYGTPKKTHTQRHTHTHIYIYMYVCIYIYTYMNTRTYVYTCLYIHIHRYTYICIYTDGSTAMSKTNHTLMLYAAHSCQLLW